MSEKKARRLTAALVNIVHTLEPDNASGRFPWLDKPEEVSCTALFSALLALSEESAGRDRLELEPVEMLGGIAKKPTPLRTSPEIAQHSRLYPRTPRGDGKPSEPIQYGISQIIDILGTIIANLMVAGVPLDEHLDHLEYWLHEIREISKPSN